MLEYFLFIFTQLTIFIVNELKLLNAKVLFIIFALCYIFFIGFRGDIGFDYVSYELIFSSAKISNSVDLLVSEFPQIELGFLYLSYYIVKIFSINGYVFFQLAFSIIILISQYICFIYIGRKMISLLTIVVSYCLTQEIDLIRQSIVIYLSLLAVASIYRFKGFYLIIFSLISIHQSVFFLSFIGFINRIYKARFLHLILIIMVIFIPLFMQYILSDIYLLFLLANDKFLNYEMVSSYISVKKIFIIYLLALLYFKYKMIDYNFKFNQAMLGIFYMYVFTYAIIPINSIADRFGYLFFIGSGWVAIIIGESLYSFRKVLHWGFIWIYIFLRLFMILNEDVTSRNYIPYENYLLRL